LKNDRPQAQWPIFVTGLRWAQNRHREEFSTGSIGSGFAAREERGETDPQLSLVMADKLLARCHPLNRQSSGNLKSVATKTPSAKQNAHMKWAFCYQA
jgi:hypothetical protein